MCLKFQGSIFIQTLRVYKIVDIKGLRRITSIAMSPIKKPQDGELTQLERAYNHTLSQERIGIEHINRSLKIFRILAGRYRNRRRRYNLRCNLIAAIYNYELSLVA